MSEEKKEFDLVGVNVCGHRFAMPKTAAFALFEAMQGHEIYKIDAWYKNGEYSNRKECAAPLEFEHFPSIVAINPVWFHTLLISQKEYEEYERAKKNV